MAVNRETKRLRNAKLRYFVAGVCAYVIVYVVCLLLLMMVQMIVTIPPYLELTFACSFFFIAAWAVKRIVRIHWIMNWVRP